MKIFKVKINVFFPQVVVLAISVRTGSDVPVQFGLPIIAYITRPFASVGAAALLLLI
jgi:hypothetical protein